VLKHGVLVQILDYLVAKEAPLAFIDTHAGAGSYSLSDPVALKKGEFREGISRIWDKPGLPPLLADYLREIRRHNPDGKLRHYPGSPQIARQVLRKQDKIQLFELHSTEGKVLQKYFAKAGRQVTVHPADGFEALKAVLPPLSRRGLVLIDPSYEDKADYGKVVATVRDALKRFATGVYAVWYPQVQRQQAMDLPSQLKQLTEGDWLNVSLTVKAPAADGVGLHGSGMFVFNQPWKLQSALREGLPVLSKLLAQDGKAVFKLQVQQH
jgi:23S rRNA (adenine2030-N6)-methyltransferase